MIAVSTMLYSDLDLERAITALASSNLFKDLELSHIHLDGVNVDQFIKISESISDLLSTYSLSMRIAHAPTVISEVPGEYEAFKRISSWLEALSKAELEYVVIHSFYTRASLDMKLLSWLQKQFELNKRLLKRIDLYAKDLGLMIFVENSSKKWITTNLPQDLIELIEDLESTKICFDVGHAHVNGYNLLEFYKYIRNHLGVVHLHDNDGTKDQHLPPYSGSIDWASLLKCFNKNNLYVLEVYGTSIKAANTLKWLAHFVKINGMT